MTDFENALENARAEIRRSKIVWNAEVNTDIIRDDLNGMAAAHAEVVAAQCVACGKLLVDAELPMRTERAEAQKEMMVNIYRDVCAYARSLERKVYALTGTIAEMPDGFREAHDGENMTEIIAGLTAEKRDDENGRTDGATG